MGKFAADDDDMNGAESLDCFFIYLFIYFLILGAMVFCLLEVGSIQHGLFDVFYHIPLGIVCPFVACYYFHVCSVYS